MIENGQPDGGFVLHYGGQRIPFRIAYRPRKHLAISVLPNLRVEVVAPVGTTLEAILPRVERRAGWIVRQLRFFEQYQPAQPGPSYASGETHLYLGRQYRLKVADGTPESVKLVGRFFRVAVRTPSDTGRVRELLDGWYREHAWRVFDQRLAGCLEATTPLRLAEPPRIVVRRMAKRWGSCTKAGNVILNLDLVKAPVHCIDYVIVHELCHLKVHNHGKEFYRLLARCMPDWQARKRRLEAVALG
jgi:predicted metal-dependent hydrolase